MLKKFFCGGHNTPSTIPPVARNYYVSEDGVGDGLTDATPASKTLVETAFSEGLITSGDAIYFKRGGSYYIGDLVTPILNGFTIGAFGTGVKPKIYGSSPVGSWNSLGSGIYSTVLSSHLKGLYVGGVTAKLATSAWITSTAIISSTVIRGNSGILNAFSNLVGAKIRVFSEPWILSNELTILAYDSLTGNITTSGAYDNFGGGFGTVEVGVPFLIYDQLQHVTENNEYYYDSSTFILYYKSAVNPATLDIRVRYKDDFLIPSGENFSITGLEMLHYNYGIRTATNILNNSTLNDLKATDCKSRGVRVQGNFNTLTNTDYVRLGDASFLMMGNNLTVENNTGNTIGMDPHYPFGFASAFVVSGNNNVVRKITMNNTAYNGAQVTGINFLHEKCVYTNTMKRITDGGGVYSSGSTANPAVSTNHQGIFRNIFIYDISTTVEGNLVPVSTVGMYIDNRCGDMTVEDCTIIGANYGMLANWNTKGSIFKRNIVIGSIDVLVLFREDTSPAFSPLYTNNNANLFEDNIIAARSASAICIEARHRNGNAAYNPFSNGGNADNNHYVKPYGTNIARARATEAGAPTDYTLAGWRTRVGDEAASTERANYITFTNAASALQEVKVEMNHTDDPVNFNVPAGYTDHNGNAFSNPVVIAPWTSLAYFKNTAFV